MKLPLLHRPFPKAFTAMPERVKPNNSVLPTRRLRLRKSWKHCARSAHFLTPAVRGQTWFRSCRPVKDFGCGAEQGAIEIRTCGTARRDTEGRSPPERYSARAEEFQCSKYRKKKQNDFASDSQFAIRLRIAFFSTSSSQNHESEFRKSVVATSDSHPFSG